MSDELQTEIEKRAREIHTDRYSMSLGEVVSMYQDGDLEVHPEFQRIFRWSTEQQSRLIESIFLGIPVPPMFVATRPDGVWDVIDGVQRLSSIFRFMGVLKDAEGNLDRPVPLKPGEYIKGLDSLVWDQDLTLDQPTLMPHELSEAQRRNFKRARIDFQIIQKESDKDAKYDLFQRLNSGTRLSEQEARNCLAVMLDPAFATWLTGLAGTPSYDHVVDISDRKEGEAYNVESVLRYLACTLSSHEELQKMGDVGEFLTTKMRHFIASTSFDRELEAKRFHFVFESLDQALGSDACKRYDPQKDAFSGRFSISAFEAISSGLARNWDAWVDLDGSTRSRSLQIAAKQVWLDPVFDQRAGGGKPAYLRIPYMVEVGERIFRTPTA